MRADDSSHHDTRKQHNKSDFPNVVVKMTGNVQPLPLDPQLNNVPFPHFPELVANGNAIVSKRGFGYS